MFTYSGAIIQLQCLDISLISQDFLSLPFPQYFIAAFGHIVFHIYIYYISSFYIWSLILANCEFYFILIQPFTVFCNLYSTPTLSPILLCAVHYFVKHILQTSIH